MPRLSKRELLSRIIEGCRDAGWDVLVLQNESPFLIRIFSGAEHHLVRVYIWNLTHGGKPRAEDEFRIQITGIDANAGFLLGEAEKVLILGWWPGAEVFVGFDFAKHHGPLGKSPSIQVREDALRRAFIQGLATQDKGNGEIAVAFRPEFLPEYVRDLEALHGFGRSPEEREFLERVVEDPEELAAGDLTAMSFERQKVVATVVRTLRDNSFTARVLSAYGSSCAFCDIQLKLIDAAHILPVSDDGSDETSNGLALCTLHHRAFDRGLVTVTEEYQILLNEGKLSELRGCGLDGGEERFRHDLRTVIRLPPTTSDRPATARIREANRLRGWV